MLEWLKLLVVLSPFLTYGIQEVRMKWEVAKAISQTKYEQTIECNKRVALIEQTVNAAAEETIRLVREGQDATPRTPIDKAQLKMLCDADANCRDKGKP